MKKTFIQSAVTMLLALMIAAAVFAAVSMNDSGTVFAATSSGSCGDNTSFVLNDDGVLTISGTGPITAYGSGSKWPWYSENKSVKKVIVEEGVTTIPANAFFYMENLKSMQLPSTLETWGGTSVLTGVKGLETVTVAEGDNFSSVNNIMYGMNGGNCTRLILSGKKAEGEVVIPGTVTAIEQSGLDGCSGITSLKLPDNLETIGTYAFRDLDQIKTITIPAGITALPNYLFSGCSSLETVTLPAGITSIGTNVFQDCTSLESFTVPGGIEKVNNNTFKGCTGLKTVVLPESITNIGTNVFDGCTSLTDINIPASAKTIGASAFLNCSSLKSITLPDGMTALSASVLKGCSSLESLKIPDTVKTIGNMALQQCSSLEEITIPEGVKTLGGTFADCSSLKTVNLPSTLTTLTAKSTSCPGVFEACTSLEEVSLPAQVKTVSTGTFIGCTSLKSLCLTDSITSIGQNAYQGCNSLEDITIPSTFTSVGSGSFKDCKGLRIVRLEEGMKKFGSNSNAFEGCDCLTDLYLPDSMEDLNPAIFEKAYFIQNIHLGENSKYVFEKGVLYDKDKTTLIFIPASYAGTLVVPDTVKMTSGYRVAGFSNAITGIEFPEGFESVGNNAFTYAKGIKTIKFPSTLTSIGDSSFQNTAIESLVIPDNVTSIGKTAFNSCAKLKYVHIGSGVTELKQGVFQNCPKLEKIDIPEGLKSIGSNAFSGCMIPEIIVPDGCETISSGAFANNTSLDNIIIPASVTGTKKAAPFTNDTNLKYIFFKGTEEQWTTLNWTNPGAAVVYNYKGTDKDLDPAVIAKQPEGAVYKKDDDPAELIVKVSPTDTVGEQYHYTWFANTTGEPDGGVALPGTPIESDTIVSGEEKLRVGMSCKPTTDKIGTKYYYCVITRMVNGYVSEKTISDVVPVTVKMDLEGSGSEKDPFLLKTADDLKLVYNTVKEGNTLSGTYLQMANDIELPADWDPIGTLKEGETGSAQGANVDPFSGVFDGGGNTIKVPEGGKPLFGYVRNAVIRNLNIFGVKINGTGLVDHYERDYEAGSTQSEFGSDANYIVKIENVTLKKGTKTRESGLIGENNNSQDASCKNPVLVVSCKAEEGVEIGYNHDEKMIGSLTGRVCGMIINCESYADVFGAERVGGLAGCQDVAMGILHVINSSFHGNVHASGSKVGGILGTGYTNGSAPNALCVEIRNCYADGTVEGSDMVGGIMGAEDMVAQCWDNGIGYIYNNLFTGTIKAPEGAKYVGGTVGFYRSLNKYTNFSNNIYKEGCGATKGIGGAQFIDTNAETHETESGATYINTENGSSACPPVSGCDWKAQHNRTDDPLGADADAISYKATSEELASDDKMLKKLNEDTTSMHNWVMGEGGYPVLSNEVICYQLTLSGSYKDEYEIGDELDTTGMQFKAAWTDGSETEPKASDITFSGFDPKKRGYQTVRATYGAGTTEFKVKVLLPDHGEKITVSFSMYGDDKHGEAATPHTMKMDTLQCWIEKKEFEVSLNATAFDVLQMALDEQGWKARVNGGYVAGITKDGQELSEKDNGADSGWMYTLNGAHSQNMLPEQFLMDGDEIVFHYTDDYHFEEDALDVSDVKELIAIIDELPGTDKASEEHRETVARANELMNGLKDNKDRLVSAERKDKLEAFTEALTDYMVDKAEQAISDITGTTIEDEESVAAARAAYDALTAEEQDMIPPEYVVKLLNAEQKINKAKQEKEAEEAAEQAEIERQQKEEAEMAARALAEAREKAIDEIQEYADLMTDKADANSLRIVVLEARDQLKSANDQEAINTIVENAKKAIDDQVQAQTDAAEAAAKKELDDAKAAAASAVALVNADDYVDADKAKVEAAIQAAGATLESAETVEQAADALRAFNNAVAECKTKAEEAAEKAEKADRDLAKARKDSISSINQYYDEHANGMYEGDKLKAQVTVLSQILFINSAESKDDISGAVKKATDDIDARVAFKTETEAAKAAAKNYKVKNLKATAKSKKFTVKWNKASDETGYQVQYKLKKAKKFRNLKKSVKSLKVTSKKLKKGQKYIFRVRTYKTINGAKVYGKWVKTKAVKCK